MSNRLFQGIVHQMKDAVDRTIGVIDETSVVIACSELGKIGEVNESINSETLSSTAPFVISGYTYKSFGNSAKYDYAVFVQGTDEYAQKYAHLLAVSFASIKQYYDEKYDRSNFIKPFKLHQERNPGQHSSRRYLPQGKGAPLQQRGFPSMPAHQDYFQNRCFCL